MKNIWLNQRTLISIIGLTTVGFILWMVVLFLLWLVLNNLGFEADFWDMMASLSTALAAAAFLGAGYIAYRELAEISSSRHMDVADRIFQELNSPENIEARRRVYQNLPDDPQQGISSLSANDQAAVKKVLNTLDRVAFLTQAGWIPEDLVMPWMHPMIAKSWEKLESYVQFEVLRRNEPYYYEHARDLAERCRIWRQENLADVEVKWVEKAL